MDGQGSRQGWSEPFWGMDMVVLDTFWRTCFFVCSQDDVNLRLLVAIYERYISEWVCILPPPLIGWVTLGKLLNLLHLL